MRREGWEVVSDDLSVRVLAPATFDQLRHGDGNVALVMKRSEPVQGTYWSVMISKRQGFGQDYRTFEEAMNVADEAVADLARDSAFAIVREVGLDVGDWSVDLRSATFAPELRDGLDTDAMRIRVHPSVALVHADGSVACEGTVAECGARWRERREHMFDDRRTRTLVDMVHENVRERPDEDLHVMTFFVTSVMGPRSHDPERVRRGFEIAGPDAKVVRASCEPGGDAVEAFVLSEAAADRFADGDEIRVTYEASTHGALLIREVELAPMATFSP